MQLCFSRHCPLLRPELSLFQKVIWMSNFWGYGTNILCTPVRIFPALPEGTASVRGNQCLGLQCQKCLPRSRRDDDDLLCLPSSVFTKIPDGLPFSSIFLHRSSYSSQCGASSSMCSPSTTASCELAFASSPAAMPCLSIGAAWLVASELFRMWRRNCLRGSNPILLLHGIYCSACSIKRF